MQVIRANDASDRATVLLALRHDLENLKIMSRLGHESGGFANMRSYPHVAEWIVNLAKQNEGWLRQTLSKGDIIQVHPAEGGIKQQGRRDMARTGEVERFFWVSLFHHCASDPPAKLACVFMQGALYLDKGISIWWFCVDSLRQHTGKEIGFKVRFPGFRPIAIGLVPRTLVTRPTHGT